MTAHKFEIDRWPLVSAHTLVCPSGGENAKKATGMPTRIARLTRREWLLVMLATAPALFSGCTLPDFAGVLPSTQAQVAASSNASTLAAEGYVYSRTYRVDGTVREASAITWVDAWTKPGSADKDDISVVPNDQKHVDSGTFAPVGEISISHEVDAKLDEIAAALDGEKKKPKK